MDQPGADPGPAPYRRAFSAAVGSALVGGTVVALADTLTTLGRAKNLAAGEGRGFVLIALGLYLGAALAIGLIQGLVAGSVRATHPQGAIGPLWRRLRSDEGADRSATAALLAAGAGALAYALVVAVLSLSLVASVERKGVGAILLGFAAVAALPFALAVAYPAYRLARRVARVVPRTSLLPASALLALGLAVAGLVGAAAILVARLDWRALQVGHLVAFLGFLGAQAATLALSYGPLAGLRRRLPGRGKALLGASLLAAAACVLAARAQPSPRQVALLTVESQATKRLVNVVRGLSDADGDGWSAALGGADCDDHDRYRHPGATDEPGNGIDENCNGADAVARAPKQPKPDPGAERWRWDGNVLIIAVDTLRADRLGVAGYTRRGGKSLTPNIDALAARGVRFTRVWAQSPHTPRSFPSLFTSRYPSAIKWDNPGAAYPKVLPENTTLFEVLGAAGIHTEGESSHFYFIPERGITQGADAWDNTGAQSIKDSNTDIASPRIVPRAAARLSQLAAEKRRFALFVHLFEPHSTYVVHEGVDYKETGMALFEEKYDREIEYVDRWVGELLAAVDAAGLADSTMVVLLADHGEAFFVHSYGGKKLGWHGQTLYDEVMRVPLIVAARGLEPRVVDTPVMLLDVAPTITEAMGVDVPESFQGRSLVPALAGETMPGAPAAAELIAYPAFQVSMKMLVSADGRHKIIHNLTDSVFELYDLETDPEERKDLAYDDQTLLTRMKAELAGWVDSLQP